MYMKRTSLSQISGGYYKVHFQASHKKLINGLAKKEIPFLLHKKNKSLLVKKL